MSTSIDHRDYETGMCLCKYPFNLVKQALCANFLYNSDTTRCVFNKFNGTCDATTSGYDNVIYFDEERKK